MADKNLTNDIQTPVAPSARAVWEQPKLIRFSASEAENSGNNGDDGPGASS